MWLLGDTPDTGLHFLYSDHLGSVSQIGTASGQVVAGSAALYYLFGAY